MDKQIVKSLLKGVAVIIDDDVEEKDSITFSMLESFRSANVPTVVFNRIPSTEIIESLGSISFVILDWSFSDKSLSGLEGVDLPDGLRDSSSNILPFLQVLLDKWFVPVYVITGKELSTVKDILSEADLYHEDKPNRIMVTAKQDITDYESLLDQTKKWLEEMPSAYALKLWEKEAEDARNQMFMELYQASPGWVNVLLQCMKQDAHSIKGVINHEFTELLNNIFTNRMKSAIFSDICNETEYKQEAETIRKVLQSERYITYNPSCLPEISYLGDLYIKEEGETKTYYLNIRAQCDLIREPDPILYLIQGEAIDRSKIKQSSKIALCKDDEKTCLKINNIAYPFEDLDKMGGGDRREFNTKLREALIQQYVFSQGEVIEKKIHSIVSCIADQYAIEFFFKSFMSQKKSKLEEKGIRRIGKLIPPYITRVQKSFAAFMMREGVMSIPEDLFK